MVHHGILSVIPVLVLFIMAFVTKKSLEPLFVAAIVGCLILGKTGFIGMWINSLYKVMSGGTMQWLILVVAMFGGLIALLEKSGGLMGFYKIVKKYANSRKKSLVITWLLGAVLFLDDYLHNLTVGPTMKHITDSQKISRTELAYVINSNAANISVLVPISTWVVFFAGLLGKSDIQINGSSISAYLHCIPFLFYSWIAALMSLLFALGVIPAIGAMKKVKPVLVVEDKTVEAEEIKGDLINFLLPLAVLIVVTILKNNDVLMGVLAAIVVCLVLYLVKGVMTYNEFFKTFIQGIKNMTFINCLLLVAFTLKEANDALGLAPYIIETVKPFMVGGFLPVVTFIVCIAYAYFTSCFWSMAAVMLPIVIPLAQGMGVNVYLVAGAVFSAAAFGSQCCLFSDALIMNSAATDITPTDHGITTLPYALIGAGIAAGLYLAAGFIL